MLGLWRTDRSRGKRHFIRSDKSRRCEAERLTDRSEERADVSQRISSIMLRDTTPAQQFYLAPSPVSKKQGAHEGVQLQGPCVGQSRVRNRSGGGGAAAFRQPTFHMLKCDRHYSLQTAKDFRCLSSSLMLRRSKSSAR